MRILEAPDTKKTVMATPDVIFFKFIFSKDHKAHLNTEIKMAFSRFPYFEMLPKFITFQLC